MPTSQALVKLTACMETFLRESPEARKAMRELLDELDRELAPKPIIPPRPQAPVPRTPSPRRWLHFYGIKSFYDINPCDYGWSFVSGNMKSRVVVFERRYTSAHVTLRYYFTTGTVQLVYPVVRHPTHGDGQDPYKEVWDSDDEEWVDELRRLQENFRGLDAIEFKKMLQNAPNWFGKGYLEA